MTTGSTSCRRTRRRCSRTSRSSTDPSSATRRVLLAAWTRHAVSEVSVHDLATGARLSSVELPGVGTIGGLGERPEGGHESWFGYTDSATPSSVLHYDARSGEVSLWAKAPGTVEVPPVTSQLVDYPSKDGTTVRMLLIAQGAEPDRATADDPLRLRRLRHPARPELLRRDPGLGRGGRRLRRRPAARRRRRGRAVAPRRDDGQQAERLRRLPRRRRASGRAGLDHAGPAGHLGRVQRRPAGRRRADPAAGPLSRRRLLGAAAGHGPLRAVRPRRDLGRGVRHGERPRAARLAARLLAVPSGRGRNCLSRSAFHDLRG